MKPSSTFKIEKEDLEKPANKLHYQMKRNHILKYINFLLLVAPLNLFAQEQDSTRSQPKTDSIPISVVDYDFPQSYTLEQIVITGTSFYDKNVLAVFSGLTLGQKIKVPGEDITKAISNLWKQKLFDDVVIKVLTIDGDKISLEISVKEKPRLSTFSIKGLKKSQANTLREEITLKAGQVITDNLLSNTRYEIKKYYSEKGYLDATVAFEQVADDVNKNTAKLKLTIDRGDKIKIQDIIFEGNKALTSAQLRKLMKDTRPKRYLLAKSRFEEEKYNDDKQKVLAKYLTMGYRDVNIVTDSIYRHDDKTIGIFIRIDEGSKYFFRKIQFIGNTKYTVEELNSILRIVPGDVYDQSKLDSRLNMNQNGLDISTLYMDDGYLFFNINPVEVLVENDSIDLEIRINEGEQARINKVMVTGNTKTSDHVIMRELRTKPGQLFSRSDITRSLRELAQVGYFNPEALNVNPVPHPESGTVDIEYIVEERPNDQIELSAGWGAQSIVGTLGLTLNNFSTKRFFDKDAWSPIPSGDGQRVSLRAQTNGTFFQSYSASFTEPWLGGKKPISLTVSVFHSIQTNGYAKGNPLRTQLLTSGVNVGLGKRLKFPDDFFVLQSQLIFQRYTNFTNVLGQSFLSIIPEGVSNSLSLKMTLSRNSTDQLIYPRAGSNISMSVQFTPPYSLLNGKDYSTMDFGEKTQWLEFHKWKFDASWFSKLAGNLVLMTRVNVGMIGRYNAQLPYTPFERFWLGGAGLVGFNLDGRELIALRGYADNSLTPVVPDPRTGAIVRSGGIIYNRYTMELRYPISLNPQATVYPLVFLEAGGAWSNYDAFNPYDIFRSSGVGLRVFLPMFGLLGLDYARGFDKVPFFPNANIPQFHFILGQQF
jgi:outer membrane protein insertion porin family